MRVICRLSGDESDAFKVAHGGGDGARLTCGGATFRFDAIYEGGCSDADFFAAADPAKRRGDPGALFARVFPP